jgi:hypothetical protein
MNFFFAFFFFFKGLSFFHEKGFLVFFLLPLIPATGCYEMPKNAIKKKGGRGSEGGV